DALGAATYFGGAQTLLLPGIVADLSSFSQINGACNGTSCTGIIAAASCYAGRSNATCGTGGAAQLALNFVDSDIRNGSFIGGSTCTSPVDLFTISCLVSTWISQWSAVAVSEGKPFLAYEGGNSIV